MRARSACTQNASALNLRHCEQPLAVIGQDASLSRDEMGMFYGSNGGDWPENLSESETAVGGGSDEGAGKHRDVRPGAGTLDRPPKSYLSEGEAGRKTGELRAVELLG